MDPGEVDMQDLDIQTEISSNGGLFFQTDLNWQGESFSLPTTTTPVGAISGTNYPDPSMRNVVDAYVRVSAADLDRYRELKKEGDEHKSDIVADILTKFKDRIETETKVLFFEYTETQEISREDMRTMVEILEIHSEIIPKPLQPKLTDAIKSDSDSNAGWDNDIPPFRAYRNSTEDFLDIGADASGLLMGTLSSIGFSRLQEITKTYIESDLYLFAYDWRGCKPSKPENHDQIQQLIKHLGKQGQLVDQVFYSLNHEKYHPTKNTTYYPPEAVALVGMGFGIIGGTFVSGGGGDGVPDSLKILDPNKFWYQDIPFDAEVEEYPVNPSISLEQIAESSPSKNQDLRKLINFESLSSILKKLRAAIDDGHEQSYLEGKEGYSGDVSSAMQSMAIAYEDAISPGPDDAMFSSP